MKQLEYLLRFNTPAFLGNANQAAQWRTPPFKALIRQWWRVVKARDFDYDHRRMRTAELALFGAASDERIVASHRSQVGLRLSSWDAGSLSKVPEGDKIEHPEVQGGLVGANLYLGYGPIGTAGRNAIAPNEQSSKLRVVCPDAHVEEMRAAMQMAAWFGTMGSRARNGWGALHVEGESIQGFGDLNSSTLASLVVSLPLQKCLEAEWMHVVGCDEGGIPFVWRLLKVGKNEIGQSTLGKFESWKEVMQKLAQIKIRLRTHFKFDGGGRDGHATVQSRHFLAYPSGSNHSVQAKAWGNNGRLANQVLFKVHRRGDGFAATIAHFPSRLPDHMTHGVAGVGLADQLAVWTEVHRLLDAEKSMGLIRIKGATA